jgi:O-methyltransferase involved in polyketide biosynthesis
MPAPESSGGTQSTVSETAVLTLRARADEHARASRLFADPLAEAWMARLSWPASMNRWYTPFAQAKTAIRAAQLDRIVRELLRRAPTATLVELGAGFSTRAERLALPPTQALAVDLAGVIAQREALGAPRARMVAASVLEPGWMEAVPAGPTILVAEGLLYYLPRSEVDALMGALGRRFAGAPMVFDVIGALDLPAAARSSRRAGAPILWAVEPPLDAAHARFGLEAIEGLEPAGILAETVQLFGRRYGPLFAWVLERMTRIRWLAGRRSGIVVGRLAKG